MKIRVNVEPLKYKLQYLEVADKKEDVLKQNLEEHPFQLAELKKCLQLKLSTIYHRGSSCSSWEHSVQLLYNFKNRQKYVMINFVWPC